MVAIYVSLYNFTLPWGKQLIWFFRHFNPDNKKFCPLIDISLFKIAIFPIMSNICGHVTQQKQLRRDD